MTAPAAADGRIPTIGYIRVSMAREEMISPELQRTSIESWAKRTSHRIIDWIEDLDKTGRNFNRKVMRAIERVEAGEARVIAVWKFSRFGRTRTGVEANLARIEQAGGELLSATEEVDSTTAAGWFQRDVFFSVAAFESKRAGEQWTETHQWRRDEGLPATGGKRFGYIWHPRKLYAPDGSVTLQEEHYEPDPETKDLVADLYRRYTAGTGFKNLASMLNHERIPNGRGSLWSDRTLCIYMDSGFAAGYLRVHDPACRVVPYVSRCPNHLYVRHPSRQHPAIISDDLWQQYLERRAFTRTAHPLIIKGKYPLTGLCRCALCGGAAVRKVNGRGLATMSCDTKARKGASVCAGFGTPTVGALEEKLGAWLSELAAEIDAKRPVAQLSSLASEPSAGREREQAKGELEKLERAVSKHMRVYALADLDDPDGTLEREYLATLAELREQKAAAVARLAELSAVPEAEQVEARRAAAVPVVDGLLEEWNSLSGDQINGTLRKIVQRIDLSPGGGFDPVPVWASSPVRVL